MSVLTESQLRSIIRTEIRRTLNEGGEFGTPTTAKQLLDNIKQFTQGGMDVQGEPARRGGGVLPEEVYKKAFDLLERKLKAYNFFDKKIVVYGPTYRDNMEITGKPGYEYDVNVYHSDNKVSRIISLPQEMAMPLHLNITKI